MNSFYTLLLLLLSVGSAVAQNTRELKKVDSLDVPQNIIRQFYKLAPTSRQVLWTFEHTTQVAGPDFDFYRSKFNQDNNPGGTTFLSDGKLLDFQVYARLDTLPSAVQYTIKRQVKKVKLEYPDAVMDICVMADTQENPKTHKESLVITNYIVEFYKSAKDRLELRRIYRFSLTTDNKGGIIKKDKNYHPHFR